MKKAVVLLANGFEEIEALTPADYLRRAGAEVLIVATGTSTRTVEGAHKITVLADMTLDSYFSSSNELPDVVVIPGGMPGAINISESTNAMTFINTMFEQKKLVAAICASPAVVLGKTNILKNKKWTCYPNMEQGVLPEYQKNHIEEPFVTDENLLTSRGPGTAERFAMEIIRILYDEQTKQTLMKNAVQG